MPDELRVLVFNKAEVARALHALRSRRGEPLPDGRLLAVELSEAGNIKARVVIRGRGDRRLSFDFGEVDIAAALILHCINSSIPLPVAARKQLQRAGERVALVIARGHVPDAVGEVVARAAGLEPAQS